MFFGYNLDAFWDYIYLLYGKKIVFINYSQLSKDNCKFIDEVIYLINENNVNYKDNDEYLIGIEVIM